MEENFGINKEEEPIFKTFSCGLVGKINLRGKMYISKRHIYFHSYFNDSTIFGKATKLEIPLIEIKEIKKNPQTISLSKPITIITEATAFDFIYFSSREKAFEFLHDTVFPKIQNNLPLEEKLEQNEIDQEALKYQISKEEILKKEGIQAEDPGFVFVSEKTFNCPLWVITHLIYEKDSLVMKELNEKYNNIVSELSRFDKIPDFFLRLRKIETDIASFSKMNKEEILALWNSWQLKYYFKNISDHLLKNIPNIPFFPKSIHSINKKVMYILGPHKLIVDEICTPSGVPFASNFQPTNRLIITQYPYTSFNHSEFKTKIIWKFNLVVLKKTIFESIYFNSSLKDIKYVCNDLLFKILDKNILTIIEEMKSNDFDGKNNEDMQFDNLKIDLEKVQQEILQLKNHFKNCQSNQKALMLLQLVLIGAFILYFIKGKMLN